VSDEHACPPPDGLAQMVQVADAASAAAGPGASEPSRREFLACVVAGCAAAAMGGCTDFLHTEFGRKNFREMTAAERAEILADLERKHSERFGKPVSVGQEPPIPGVEFAYALDISRCVGCRRCVYACVQENNQSRDPQVHWIRVLEMQKDRGIDFADANPYYDAETVPRDGHFYLPVACQQCRDAPCVKTCPVGATWQEPDGIVAIDYDWCIGCRCCMAACPYGARHFNWTEPGIPAGEANPSTHYLGNRPRMRGVVEKCTFCVQRVRKGLYPACVEVCPVGARKFGDLNDPNSEIRYVFERKRVFVLKHELNTRPRFYYFYGL
jgi:molybdopterin-containing oxidoreductase family iron-sulfur binding subunit